MKRLTAILLLTVLLAACGAPSVPESAPPPPPSTEPSPAPPSTKPATAEKPFKVVVDRQPGTRVWPMKKLDRLPEKLDMWEYYFPSTDLSGLDLSNSGQVLADWASFSTRTVWPDQLPPEFKPAEFMALGKDPGLGVRDLHQKGITGKGVAVAILDQTLLRGHTEYAGRIRRYVEIGQVAPQPEMHGAAVASILGGKTVGVAPDVTIDYYATQFVTDWQKGTRTFRPMAQAIHMVLDRNKELAPAERVRVISASIGAGKNEDGYTEVMAAYRRAVAEGVLVVTTDMENRYPFFVHGLNRDPLADPNRADSYRPGGFWASRFEENPDAWSNWARTAIYAPMDSRTVAAETGEQDYRFDRLGGLSWSVPYVAGVYALAVQADPAVTPEAFLKAANETGTTITYTKDGKEYRLGPVINPGAIVKR